MRRLSSLLFIVAAIVLSMADLSGAGSSADPATPSSGCTVPPRTGMGQVTPEGSGDSEGATPPAAEWAEDWEFVWVELYFTGDQPEPAVEKELTALVEQFFTCLEADEPLRLLTLFSDYALAELFPRLIRETVDAGGNAVDEVVDSLRPTELAGPFRLADLGLRTSDGSIVAAQVNLEASEGIAVYDLILQRDSIGYRIRWLRISEEFYAGAAPSPPESMAPGFAEPETPTPPPDAPSPATPTS